jgi:exopolysaccharide biosynthesis WecB/TagA/CpsF family protein
MLLDDADLLHADGQSVVSMARHFLAGAIPERSATTDMFTDIATVPDVCLRHYLLGGEDAAVSKCSRIMEAKYERFSCVGTHHGYFDEWEVENVIKEINDSGADILWVGLGKPKEQEFVYAHRDKINVPIIITCGGCYNYVTGDYRRAPLWIQKAGFEWLHRALTEPRKLLFRYVTTSPHAIYCVLRHRFRKH